MKRAFHLLSLGAALIAINACTSRSVDTEGALGPYDAQGNYIEEWADNPKKWKYPAGGASGRNEVPKGDVTPLWGGRNEPNVILPSTDGSSSSPPTKAQTATRVTAPPPTVSEPRSSTPTSRSSASTSRSSASSNRSRSSTPKSTAKTSKSKPKPKPKPAPTRAVTIKQGDSLSKIAARNGTTVSALKQANGLKGDRIVAGKSLKIPPKKR